jgi:threonine dehydratase
MALSWPEGRPVSSQTTATMADGLAVRVPVPAAVEWMREYVDDMVLVSEESIWRALEVVRDTLGLLVEPTDAVGIAAALEYGRHGSPLGTIITGGNFSAELFASLTGDAPAR